MMSIDKNQSIFDRNDQYRELQRLFLVYWSQYGGFNVLLRSPFFHAAALITFFSTPIWISDGWWSYVLSILPSILGFTLAGYAIFLAISDERFRNLIAGKDPEDDEDEVSPYFSLSVSFLHFIIVQIVAITLTLISISIGLLSVGVDLFLFGSILVLIKYIFWGVSFFTFVYSMMCGLAATVLIFRTTQWYDDAVTSFKKDES